MSDAPGGSNWWQASDGKWYPPADQAPEPGWWLASDGKWYPPADQAPEPGWWLASDGTWYPPRQGTAVKGRVTATAPPPTDGTSIDAAAFPPPRDPPVATGSAATGPKVDAAAAPKAPAAMAAPATPASSDPTPASAAVPPSPPKKKAVKKVTKKVTKKVAKKVAQPRPAASPTTSPTAPGDTAPEAPGASSGGSPVAATTTAPRPAASTPTETKAPPTAATDRGTAADRRSTDEEPITRAFAGTSPEHQIATRNQASRADAQVLQAARSAAAASALAKLKLEASTEPEITSAAGDQRGPATPPAAETTKPAEPDSGRGATTTADREPAARREEPLLEARPVAYATDVDHIGDRLAVYSDRVELLDRNNNVRSVMPGSEIADVVVSRKLKTAVLTVEAGDGATLQIKGLRVDEADEARELIIRQTRRVGPAPPRPDRPAAKAPGPSSGKKPTKEQLLRMLDILHRSGVLSDAELAEKRATVEQLHDKTLAAPAGR
ncbi:MAG: hypothetical protein JJU45_06600 [Acidimicrobiia bacterium]|nr:hypothetical protein [Acidimicrobiia bacterium]